MTKFGSFSVMFSHLFMIFVNGRMPANFSYVNLHNSFQSKISEITGEGESRRPQMFSFFRKADSSASKEQTLQIFSAIIIISVLVSNKDPWSKPVKKRTF